MNNAHDLSFYCFFTIHYYLLLYHWTHFPWESSVISGSCFNRDFFVPKSIYIDQWCSILVADQNKKLLQLIQVLSLYWLHLNCVGLTHYIKSRYQRNQIVSDWIVNAFGNNSSLAEEDEQPWETAWLTRLSWYRAKESYDTLVWTRVSLLVQYFQKFWHR